MEELVHELARTTALAINIVAVVVVAWGVLEAIVALVRGLIANPRNNSALSAVWFAFARWLIAGLTFQLAADVVQSAVTPTWDDLGKFAATAAIRTFLSWSLDRDISGLEARERTDRDAART